MPTRIEPSPTSPPLPGLGGEAETAVFREVRGGGALEAGTPPTASALWRREGRIEVYVDAAATLVRELRRRRIDGLQLGPATARPGDGPLDPYHPAEARRRLMPGIITSLARARIPFVLTTTRPLLLRDLPVLRTVAGTVPIAVTVPLPHLDDEIHHALSPTEPTPRERLDLVHAVADTGIAVHVCLDPVIPYLTDDRETLGAVIDAALAAGAGSISARPLRLREDTIAELWGWLQQRHPALLPRHRQLYAAGPDVPAAYRARLGDRLADLLGRHRVGFRAVPRRVGEATAGTVSSPPNRRSGRGLVDDAQLPLFVPVHDG